MLKHLASLLVLGASACTPVPAFSEEQPKRFPLVIITKPADCAAQGGCYLVSEAVFQEAVRLAVKSAMAEVPTCRREEFI